ncbi:MAG: hypothetical protein CMN30_14745 [Sandaracinus sp.]|nr:hypothetical protein [Sandaracinus sp.]|tara:strand:- start:1456 stop:2100 length:645 start_codon:yes stop_codon:yes gene_type:complete
MKYLSTASLALVAIALTACGTENAVLDVQMGLPANPLPDHPLYARVFVGRQLPVADNARVPEAHELGASPSTYQFSIDEAEPSCDTSVTGACDLFVEVRFCVDPDCVGLFPGEAGLRPEDPQAVVRYRVERPLFTGQRTQWEPRVAEVPTCADDVASCTATVDPTDDGCTADVFEGAPAHECDVANCEAIICAADPGGIGGYCVDGRSGPHLCE